MSKQQLQEGALLHYTGTPFDGFIKEEPQATFLGYDTSGWSSIWVDYRGETRMVSLSDIEIIAA